MYPHWVKFLVAKVGSALLHSYHHVCPECTKIDQELRFQRSIQSLTTLSIIDPKTTINKGVWLFSNFFSLIPAHIFLTFLPHRRISRSTIGPSSSHRMVADSIVDRKSGIFFETLNTSTLRCLPSVITPSGQMYTINARERKS